MEGSIAKGEINDPISPDLSDGSDTARFEIFAKSRDEGGGGGGCCAGVLGCVTAEAGIDDELASVVGFGEFKEEDSLTVLE